MFALRSTVECSLAEEEEQEVTGKGGKIKEIKEVGEKGLRGGRGVCGDEGRKSPGTKKAPALGRDQTAQVAKQNHM